MLNIWDIILCISTTNYHLHLPAYSCCSQRGGGGIYSTSQGENWSTASDVHFVSYLVPISKLACNLLKDTCLYYQHAMQSSKNSLRKSGPTMSLPIFSNIPSIFYMHRNTKKNASHYTKIEKLDTMAPKFYPPLCPVRSVLLTPTPGQPTASV